MGSSPARKLRAAQRRDRCKHHVRHDLTPTCQPSPPQDGDEDVGFNAAAGRFENMVAAGIIDPMKVGWWLLCRLMAV